jgi:hypothetical protein
MTLITKSRNENENLVFNLNLALGGRNGNPSGISFNFRSKTRLKVYSKVKVQNINFTVINIQLIESGSSCKGYLYTVMASGTGLEYSDSFDLKGLYMEPVTILN